MKTIRFLFVLLMAAALPMNALAATEELTGNVVAGYEVSLSAPISGTVVETDCRAGQWVEAGDVLATVELTRVFSPVDGTVGAVEAQPGDSAESTVLSIFPVSKYTVTASTEELYGVSDPARYYIHLGETLHIRCTKDRSHVAVGVVTAVDGPSFTVETTGGELYMEEEVNLYRSEGYAFSSWVGTGTVARTEARAISGSGSLLDVLVAPGQEVERGQLLFTCTAGTVDDYTPKDGCIRAESSGVLASVSLMAGSPVQKGQSVATLYPQEGFRLAVDVPEDMLLYVKEGTSLRFTLDWDENQPREYEGTVETITTETDALTGESGFVAYVVFEPDETVRLGMSAVVEVEVP